MEALFRLGVIVRLRDMLSGPAGMAATAMAKLAKAADGAKSVMKFGVATAAVGAGITALGVQAKNAIGGLLQPFMELEDATIQVATAWSEGSGAMKASMGDVKAASLDWARNHKQSAVEFLQAMYMAEAAGFVGRGAIDATRTSLKLATATFGEAAEAAGLLGKLYNNLGDKSAPVADELDRIADMITKTQQSYSLANLGQLAAGLDGGASSAVQFRVELSQMLAVIGQLNNAGQEGAVAGTAFESMVAPMGEASRKLKFGLATAKDGGLDLIGTLANIKEKFGGFSSMSEKTQAAFKEAFGDVGLSALSLMLEKTDALKSGLAGVIDSTGAAATNQAMREASLSTGLAKLSHAFDELKVKAGDAMAPVLQKLLPQLMRVGEAVMGWVRANPELVAQLAQIAIWGTLLLLVLGPIVALLGLVILTVGGAAFVIIKLAQFVVLLFSGLAWLAGMIWYTVLAFAGFVASVAKAGWALLTFVGRALWSGITSVAAFTWTLLKAAAVLTGRFLLALGRVGAALLANPLVRIGFLVGTATYLAIKHWDDLKEAVVLAGKVIERAWEGVKSFFEDLWDGIVDGVKKTLRWLSELPGKILDGIKGALTAVGAWIVDQATAFYEAGRSLIEAMWEGMKRGFVVLAQRFEQKVRGLFGFLPDWLNPMDNLAVAGHMKVTVAELERARARSVGAPGDRAGTSRSRGLGEVPVIEVKVSAPGASAALPSNQANDRRQIIIQNMTVKADDAKAFGKSLKQVEQEQG